MKNNDKKKNYLKIHFLKKNINYISLNKYIIDLLELYNRNLNFFGRKQFGDEIFHLMDRRFEILGVSH